MNKTHPYRIRTEMIRSIRRFFEERGFTEVIPTVLQRSIPTEPNIYPFETTWRGGEPSRLFLATSPERTMKMHLADGIGPCFSIGKCFRNLEGSGSRHTPEYLMLEWYRLNQDYRAIINDIAALIQQIHHDLQTYRGADPAAPLSYQGTAINLTAPWTEIRILDELATRLQTSPEAVVNNADLRAAAASRDPSAADASWQAVFDQLIVNEIEAELTPQPTIMTQLPSRTSPLCAVDPEQPIAAQRFEFFLAGIEVANGNDEDCNAETVKDRFEQIRSEHAHSNPDHPDALPPLDERFLDSLERMQQSGNTFSGVGLGIDRLAMIFADITDITEIEPLLP